MLDKNFIQNINDIIGIFYQHTFKIFYINSLDGKTFNRPYEVFVSLGLTTSLSVIEDLCGVLNNTCGLEADIIELKTIKVSNQHLNSVSKSDGDEISQFEISDENYNKFRCFSKEEIYSYRDSLDDLIKNSTSKDEVLDATVKLSTLTDILNKISNQPDFWENNLIYETHEFDFKVFHRKVNYLKDDETEYRIGIRVTPKKCNSKY